MFLVIDIGNSQIKFHLEGETYYDLSSVSQAFNAHLLKYNGSIDFDIFRVYIVSSRKSLNADIKDDIKFQFKEIQKKHSLWFPIEFNDELVEFRNQIDDIYPELGNDRLIKTLGALKLFPEENIALFDFGTAFTLTLLNSNYYFRGGMIDIGFIRSFDLIGKYMEALPSIDYRRLERFYFDFASIESDEFSNTELAILQGGFSRIVGTINEWKKFASEQMNNPVSLACGYGSKFFAGYVDHLVSDSGLYMSAFQ